MSASHPLAGVRVLDASRVLAGPFCGQLLADLGADVVKVERPGAGDDTRGWGPPYRGDLSAYFISCNRSKRSITLDILTPAGRATFAKLLAAADVLIENFRTDSLPHLGLTADELRTAFPRLVTCSISGFGRTGPLKDAPGYDFAIQAMTGLMSVTGPADGEPAKVGVAVADVLTGLYASTAILAALRHRDASGEGSHIDLALHDCALASQVNLAQAYLTTGVVPPRQGNAHAQIVPYELFATADGQVVLNVGNDSQWRAFCGAADAADLLADTRFSTNRGRVENRGELVPRVAAAMAQHSTHEWEHRLAAATVPFAVVADYAAAFAREQTRARGMKTSVPDGLGGTVELVGNPIHVTGETQPAPRTPPRLGEHSQEVLRDWLGE